MRAIDVAGFERKFRENIDPWNYTNSGFEHFKRNVLLRACGRGKHGRALELGCAIGETTRYLAPVCLRLVALDGSPTALAEARRRVHSAHVRFVQARLPGEMPHGPFDLIVVSEIAYYLSVHELAHLAGC
jgi:SAM-dependent methyltransferase